MKSVKLTGIRKIKIIDEPVPQIKNDKDVLIKVKAVSICGSDVHYYTQGRIGNQIVKYPFTVGHEMAGVVIEAGKEVNRVKPGQKVAVDPAVSCGFCDQCKINRYHTCRNLKFLGCPDQLEGCLCEYILMPEHSCFPVSDKIGYPGIALIEPLTIGNYTVKLSKLFSGANIGILGCGSIGLSVMLMAKLQGVKNIYVTDRLDYRLKHAKNNGATKCFNKDKMNVVKELKRYEPLLLDIVYECCGKQEAISQAVQLLKPGGSLVIVGIPQTDTIGFDIHTLRRQELVIKNVRRQNLCEQETIDLVENKTLKPDFMITHNFSVNDAEKAFKIVSGYKDNVVKAVIHFD
jgi:L-iditol 2-dehydrogenase